MVKINPQTLQATCVSNMQATFLKNFMLPAGLSGGGIFSFKADK